MEGKTGDTPPTVRLVAFSVTAYCVTSIAVVYFNWWLFTKGFKFPVFVSWLQQIVGYCIFTLGSSVAIYFERARMVFPKIQCDKSTLTRLVPLSVSFVLTIASANLCLQKTQISTYQVARSLTLFFILLLSYVLLRERQSKLVILSCFLMVAGFVANSLDPATLAFYGLLFGGLSSFFQSLYNVLIKFCLPVVDNDNQRLLYYNLMLSSVLFLPIVLVCEGLEPFRESVNSHNNMYIVWGGILISGVLGTSLNMTQYLLVRVTTPLTFNIVGIIKSIMQTLGGIAFLGDRVTMESLIGISLCTVGSVFYVYAKNAGSETKPASDPENPKPADESDDTLQTLQRLDLEHVKEYGTPSTLVNSPPPVAPLAQQN